MRPCVYDCTASSSTRIDDARRQRALGAVRRARKTRASRVRVTTAMTMTPTSFYLFTFCSANGERTVNVWIVYTNRV